MAVPLLTIIIILGCLYKKKSQTRAPKQQQLQPQPLPSLETVDGRENVRHSANLHAFYKQHKHQNERFDNLGHTYEDPVDQASISTDFTFGSDYDGSQVSRSEGYYSAKVVNQQHANARNFGQTVMNISTLDRARRSAEMEDSQTSNERQRRLSLSAYTPKMVATIPLQQMLTTETRYDDGNVYVYDNASGASRVSSPQAQPDSNNEARRSFVPVIPDPQENRNPYYSDASTYDQPSSKPQGYDEWLPKP